MTKIAQMRIVTDRKIPFNVRIVRKNDRYGMADCLVHEEDDPLIEFWDARFPHNPLLGQFVARYNWETLKDRGENQGYGLALYGREADWTIDAHTMTKLVDKIDKIFFAELQTVRQTTTMNTEGGK